MNTSLTTSGWTRPPLAKEERGQALAEFAILAPIFILLLLALVDFGRVFETWVVATNAAREGARYAAVYSAEDYVSDTQVVSLSQQKAYDYLVSGIGTRSDAAYSLNDVTVSLPARFPGRPVTVNVAIRVQIWALLNIFLSNPVTIQGQATMRI